MWRGDLGQLLLYFQGYSCTTVEKLKLMVNIFIPNTILVPRIWTDESAGCNPTQAMLAPDFSPFALKQTDGTTLMGQSATAKHA